MERTSLEKKDQILAMHNEEAVVVEADKQMSAWQCIKQNPKIAMWTLYANVGSTMVGYENLALSVCLAMPSFQQTFASEVNGQLIIPAEWQSAWNATFNIMTGIGAVAAGHLQDWLGRKMVFKAAIACVAAGIGVAYASTNPAEFLGAKILTGFAIGLILTATQTYVSEVAPLPMRGIALSMNTVMMNLGMLIAISSSFSRVSIPDPSAFRVIFAAAWAFPALLAVGIWFLPESPYWLVMKNRPADARKALIALSNKHENIDGRLVQIEQTVEAERQMAAQQLGLMECFRGINWRRTRAIFICMYMPNVVGAVLSSNAPYFLNQTGLDSKTVLMLVQIGISMGVVSALVNTYAMMKIHHRPLMFFGVCLCIVMYLIMGIAAVLPKTQTSLMVIGTALQFTSISYGPAVGASMAVAGEVSATQLRAKSLGIGQAFASVCGTIWTIVLPYLFNQDQANLGGNIAWIFFGMGVIYFVILFFDVPGTKGRTYKELDIMFERKVPSRKFEKYELSVEDLAE